MSKSQWSKIGQQTGWAQQVVDTKRTLEENAEKTRMFFRQNGIEISVSEGS